MKIKVVGIQMLIKDAISKEDKENNIKRAINIIQKINSVDLIILPELFTIGYDKKTFECLSDLADTREGKTILRFCQIAKEKNCFIIFGFPEKEQQEYKNSAAIINNQGKLIKIYQKMHLPQFDGVSKEKEYFKRGDKLTSFNVDGVIVGINICYDIRFPELTRKLALKDNIDLLINLAGFPKEEGFVSWHPFVITRAVENQVYVLSLNRAGERYGKSIFCPPWIDEKEQPLILGEEESLIVGIVDTEDIKKIRKKYPLLSDRLKEH